MDMDMERFEQLQEDQDSALQALKKVWEKLARADSGEIQKAIEEAIRTKKGIKTNAPA